MEPTTTYPVYYAVSENNKVANWRPLAQWFMAIPHMIVSRVLEYAAGICAFISWFIILFTGKLPVGLADFMTMSMRYSARTYGFLFGLTEQYPEFDFTTTQEDPGGYAIRLDVNPELENRNRLTVFFRLFMLIPIGLFTAVVLIGVWFVSLIAWFAVLFTGTYPTGMRDFVIKGVRLATRVSGYAYLLTDEYPPFAVD